MGTVKNDLIPPSYRIVIYQSAAIVPVLQEPSEIKLQDVMVVKDKSMKV